MSGAPAPRSWIARVPNALSALRLALAAAFPFLPPGWRLSAVILGGMTDWLDGAVARRFDARTTFGALLDGFADKIFVFSVLMTSAATGEIAWWQAALVLVRDCAVAYTATHIAIRRDWAEFKRLLPRPSGKLTTLFVFAWLVAIYLPTAQPLEFPLFVLAAASSLVAAVEYAVRFIRALDA